MNEKQVQELINSAMQAYDKLDDLCLETVECYECRTLLEKAREHLDDARSLAQREGYITRYD